MRALLDVNVLIALFDTEHVHHARARRWFSETGASAWASCAITQNGFVRIVSQPGYAHATTVRDASRRLRAACSTRHHEFWACDFSLLDTDVAADDALSSRTVTDAYLLALAVRRGGMLVTFDTRIPLSVVPAASSDHLLVL